MTYTCCTKCVLDTSDSYITFDKDGVCNYCHEYESKSKQILHERESKLFEGIVSTIKESGGNKEYDCVIGISGGLDSSYLLYMAHKAGLRPLAVHYDCGWNTENAVHNIEKLLAHLDIDLYSFVVNWKEFRDMQLAYLKAGVVDLEIPTDHSYLAALYKTAAQFGVRHILTGHNFVTEGIMPRSWVYDKGDARNLMDIYQKHGNLSHLESFPVIRLPEKFWFYNVKKIENLHLLNYLPYLKLDAARTLSEITGWQPHPVKHGESVWTRFYQCYILPRRFGIDKRRAHLSTLICSGQIRRVDALLELEQPIYDEVLLKTDKEFVLKKFQLNEVEFEQYMVQPIRNHTDYKSDLEIKGLYHSIRRLFSLSRSFKISQHY